MTSKPRRYLLALLAGVLLVSTRATAAQQPLALYDPPAGTYPYFPHSIFLQKLGPNPGVDPRTPDWLARIGAKLGAFNFALDPAGVAHDYTFPIYVQHDADQTLFPVRIHCTEPWGKKPSRACEFEGKIVRLDPRELPETGAAPNKDDHLAIISPDDNKEYDFWGTDWPPANGTVTIKWGGFCSLSGDGYDGCHGTATSTPLSIGLVRVKDVMAALHDPHGTLPYAIAIAIHCAYGHIPPMLRGDGHKDGCPPEGARIYLDMSDDEVDATTSPLISKVILRTIDRDHYGMIAADLNGGEYDYSLQTESDYTYTSFGLPGPLVNDFKPELNAEGIIGHVVHDDYHVDLPYLGVDFAKQLKFVPTGPITDP
jgi:hypothetical protein